ncbi:hypothetical protein AACT_2255 [Arcobacter acticola]|uniref:Uncharacterized protein n=1 Tax=Arcobacter acticola TaxID=1849015 RepID=A0A6M8EMR8_9BACT|nr:hypothetical protein [Arcobacter acticola]QKE29379.1 hypothetical protein AACT_2255 [Arcobacter acticola]
MIWVNILFLILVSSLLLSDLTFLKIINSSNIITVVTAFAGALSGAWGAYKLQINKENKKEEKQKINSLNKALFILLRQINAMTMFKIDLEKVKEKEPIVRAFQIQAWKTNPYNDLKFNFEELSFILDTEDLNLLHELFIVQESFEQAIETINQRSIYFINKVTPEMELKDIDNKKFTLDELKTEMDINKINGLVSGTDYMYIHVYRTYQQLEDVTSKLFNFAKSQYPDKKFIQFEKSIS